MTPQLARAADAVVLAAVFAVEISAPTCRCNSRHAWAFKGDCDPSAITSNTFTMEWPPESGQQVEFPEIDRADFFGIKKAMRKIKAGQEALIEELARIVDAN